MTHVGVARTWKYMGAGRRVPGYALRRIGLYKEGQSFLDWVLGIVELGACPRLLYDLGGRDPPPELVDPELAGSTIDPRQVGQRRR